MVTDLTITGIETITGFDITSGAYLFTLDELQSATISQSEEKTDITGKQGRKLGSLKKNKSVTVSGNNGWISSGLLEMQTGCKFENKVTTVQWTDNMTVVSNLATTTHVAVGTAGAEIIALYAKNSDGTLGTAYTQGSAVAAGVFTYDPATGVLTFNDGDIADGTEIVAYYMRQIQADVQDNLSDVYSTKCTLYIDAFAEDACANVYRVQFYIPKADFNGEFSIEFGEDQTVHSFEAESLVDYCGGTNGQLWTYTVFGTNSDDVDANGDTVVLDGNTDPDADADAGTTP